MTNEQAQAVAAKVVAAVAPDIDPGTVEVSARLREDLDVDSLDFLNIVEAVHDETGVDIPEADYPLITSIATLASYLAGRTAAHT